MHKESNEINFVKKAKVYQNHIKRPKLKPFKKFLERHTSSNKR